MRSWNYGSAICAVAAASVFAAAPAMAQGSTTFNIPAGSLDHVLTQIASQSGHRIAFDPALVRDKTSSGISGTMTPEAAVRQALAGTNLVLRASGNGDWFVVARGGQAEAPRVGGQMLGTVRVNADAGSLGTVGDNGSSDPIATEGTGSYTAKGTTLASKTPLSLKDTPESVSVVTRQQIEDRQLTSIDDTLNAAAGVTVLEDGIYSRGFEINNVTIDGGSPISIGQTSNYKSDYLLADDLSIYDSVSVLRGAAGAFTGVGNPGGVINLERKRPLDHQQFSVELAGGSYNRLRAVVDESTPYLLGDLLRARVVLTQDRQDYFYHPAKSKLSQGYVNFEIDPGDSTAINFGAKYVSSRSTPWVGLPTLDDGSQVGYSRSTCLCTDWSHIKTKGQEYFGEINQKIGDDWSIKLNTSANLQKSNARYFQYNVTFGYFGLDPDDPYSGSASASIVPTKSDQYLADVFLSGKFSLFGVDAELTAGGNFQSINQTVNGETYYYGYDYADLYNFNPDDYPLPTADEFSSSLHYTPKYAQQQYGGYVTLRLTPIKWLHLTVSQRYSHYKVDISSSDYGYVSYNKSRYKDLPIPNVGVVADITRTTSVYASYQSIFDRGNYLTTTGTLVSPSTGMNFEFGVKKAWADGKLNASLSGYYIKQNNVPAQDPSTSITYNATTGSYCCFVSDGTKYRSKGFEATLQGALTDRLQADVSYAYNDYKYIPGNLSSFTPLPLTTPRNLFKAWLQWRPPLAVLDDKLSLGLGGRVQSKISATQQVYSYDADFNFLSEYLTTYGRGYATVDASAKYQASENLLVQLNVTNLFDKTYYRSVNVQAGNYYGTPRSVLLTLRAKI